MIEERIEKFKEEEKMVETMLEMLDYMDGNEWIEDDSIQGVVEMMLNLEEVGKLLKEGMIEAWRQKLNGTWDRYDWEGMKRETRKFRIFLS